MQSRECTWAEHGVAKRLRERESAREDASMRGGKLYKRENLINLEDFVNIHLDVENGKIKADKRQVFEQLKVSSPEFWPAYRCAIE